MKFGRFILFSFLSSCFLLPSADAQVRDLFRNQAFVNNQSLGDTTITRSRHQITAINVATNATGDTLFLLSARFFKSPKDFIDTIQVYRDVNRDGLFDAGDAFLGNMSGTATATETALYSLSPDYLLPLGGESIVINVSFKTNIANGDTVLIRFEDAAQPNPSLIRDSQLNGFFIPRAVTDDTFSLRYTARIDSVGITTTFLSNSAIHPDSRSGQNPFTVFSGTVSGETRGLDRDRLTRIGVAFRGTARDSVYTAEILLRGLSDSTITLARAGNDTWFATTDSPLSAGNVDTFLVRVRVADTTSINTTLNAFIPIDSVATTFRQTGPTAASDSSGVFTFNKPTLGLTAVAFSTADSIQHPDSRARASDSVTFLHAFVTLGNTLTHDTITQIRVAFSGTAADSVYTPEVRIGSSATWFAMTEVGNDTYTRTGLTSLINATTDSLIQVRARIADTVVTGGTVFARVYIGNCTATFHETGPAAATDSSGIFTFRKPNIGATARAISPYDTFIHIDSRARSIDSVTILQGNFILANTIAFDTITSIQVSFAGTASDSVYTPEIRIGSSATWNSMTRIGTSDTYAATGLSASINATTDSGFVVRTRFADTVTPNRTLWAQLASSSCTTTFHETGPLTATDSSVIFTLGQSTLSISVTALSQADSVIHPDSRFRTSDSVTVLDGAFTLSLPATYDTITAVNVAFGGTASDSVYTPEIQIRATGAWTALTRLGTSDTYQATGLSITIVSGDTYRVRTRFADTVTTGRTLFARFHDSSVRATLSDSAPNGVTDSSIIYTIRRPNLGVTATAISQSDTVLHPDSRVRGSDSITIFSGTFSMAGGLTYDTLTQIQVAFAGTASDSVYTPEIRIGSSLTWINLVRVGTSDTYRATGLSSAINGTTDSRILVRTRVADTVTLNSTLNARIYAGFCTSSIHDTGPLTATDSSVQFTFNKPRIGVNVTFDTNRNVHVDSRARTDSFRVLVGSFTVDSAQLGFPTYDTITQIRIAFLGTAADSVLAPQILIGTDTWRTLTQVGTTDTWTVTLSQTIRNQDTFWVRSNLEENVTLNRTISAAVYINECTTTFATAGPAAATDSSGVITCTKPIFRVFATFVANDTILPAFASANSVRVGAGFLNIDTSLLTFDTLTILTVVFQGTASDSIYNARIRVGANGSLGALVKSASGVNSETFTLTADTRIADNDTYEIRVNVADTATVGTTFNVRLAASANTTVLSTTGPGSATDSSGLFTLGADPLSLGMFILGDTRIPPWAQLGSNPVLVLEGTIYTDSGPVLMPGYDTLIRFGVDFETSSNDIRNSTDSTAATGAPIKSVRLALLANAVRVADTITLVSDAASNNGLRWRLPAGSDTTIDTAQRFRVYVTVNSSESLVYDTISAQIRRDSIATRFTSTASGADTHSGRTVTFIYPDTTRIVQDLTLTDTNVNPDTLSGQNPFKIFAGTISSDAGPGGQDWFSAARDSITHFAIDLFDNANEQAADSVTAVTLYLGPGETAIPLVKVGSAPGSPATIRITSWRQQMDSPISVISGETFIVRATIAETVTLGTHIQARMFSDSVWTYFMAETRPGVEITGSRQVTFARAAFIVSAQTLGDTTVSPFRVRNDSTLAFQGAIAASENPSDSVIRFGIQLIGSSRFFGESVQVRARFETGPAGAIAFESTMVLVNANSTRPSFRLTDTFTVDSGQIFSIRVILNVDTPLIGETYTALMPADSTAARFSTGGNSLLPSGRTVTINYTDSLVITDSALGAITVHPSLIQGQNPYIAFVGRIGNRSGLSDTVQRIRFRFVGTAVGVNDSIASAVVLLNATGETMNLSRIDTVTWGVNLDSGIAAGSFMACTLVVTISETVASNTTLQATVPTDSISLLYSEDTALFTASRVATFNRGVMDIQTAARRAAYASTIQLGDTQEVMWFTAVSGGRVEADTLHSLLVDLTITGGDSTAVDTIFLVRDAGRNQAFDSAGALGDTRVGTFVYQSGSTWRLVITSPNDMITDTVDNGGSKSDTAEYLVVLRLRTTATSVTQVRASVPAQGADGPFTDSGPLATVNYDSYSVVQPDTTAPLPVTFFTVTANAGSFLIEWGASASGDDEMSSGQYNLYTDSAAQNYPTALLVARSHDTGSISYSHTVTGLVADTTYRFRVEAQDRAGNAATSAVVSAIFRGAGTPAPAAAAVMHQPIAGDKMVRARTFTVVARIADKTTASLVTGVRFDSRALSTSNNFAQIGTGVVTDTATDINGEVYYSLTFDASTTAPDSYEIRAVARTSTGFDSYPVSAGIQLLLQNDTPNATLVAYEGDSTHAADSAYMERVFSDDRQVTLIMSTPTGAFDVGVVLNAGALGADDTARIVLEARRDTMSARALAPLLAAGLMKPEYFVNITIISRSTAGAPDSRVLGGGNRVILSYIDNNNDFLDDSTGVDMRKAVIYTIDGNGFLEALTTERDHGKKILYATVTHFSPFFISNAQGVGNAGLTRLIVGPNPFRPNDGNDQTGKPYVAGDATTGVIFLNLPPNAKIEIYTLLGERITELNNSATGTSISWSVKNDNNKDVASGYYLYIVTDPATSQRVTGKVAVIR